MIIRTLQQFDSHALASHHLRLWLSVSPLPMASREACSAFGASEGRMKREGGGRKMQMEAEDGGMPMAAGGATNR